MALLVFAAQNIIMMIRCGGPMSNTAHHHITAARDLRAGDISTSLARVLREFLEV